MSRFRPDRPPAGGPIGPMAAVFLLALATAPSAGQEAGVLAEGTYRITVDGRAVGTEAFAVRRQGRDVRAVGRIRMESAVDGLPSMEVWLRTNGEFRPDLFRLRPQGPGPDAVTAVREGDRVRVRTTTPEGERYREFLAPEGVVVFDPRVAHHWYLVLRYREREVAGGAAEIPVVLPARSERVQMRVRRAGDEEVTVEGRAVSATRHEVSGGITATVWTAEDGRVVRVTLPALGLTSERIRGGGRS